jgi:ABC-type branched-subunit amino acid transport system permease subunit
MTSKKMKAVGALLVAALALLPFVPGAVDNYYFGLLFFVFVYAPMAQAWNLIVGYAGQVSLGQHAFFGLGAPMVLLRSGGIHRRLVSLRAKISQLFMEELLHPVYKDEKDCEDTGGRNSCN